MNQDRYIEQEVSRRVASIRQTHNAEVDDLKDVITKLEGKLLEQHEALRRLTSEPLYFASLIKVHNTPNISAFQPNDEVLITDRNSPHFNKSARIISGRNGGSVVDDEGFIEVRTNDEIVDRFSIGTITPAQVHLLNKDDGTYVIVNVDGKPWEIRGVADLCLAVGDTVKIRADSKQVVGRGQEDLLSGPIVRVIAVTDVGIEVEDKGDRRLVQNPKGLSLEEGDRVVIDSGWFNVLRVVERDPRNRYKLTTNDLTVSWEDIGGLEEAKRTFREAIELPYVYPELFKHYNVEREKGILLYGPPGCGKTLIVRAAAKSLAEVHGKGAVESAYRYVKSPEILNKWVGNSEAEIRQLFENARRHSRQNGYPQLLVFDEFDAIAPQRGTRVTSGIADTMVPMFLGEMDGADSEQTKHNPIIVILTNRPDVIDPAVTRPGRISKHIKIDRPNVDTSLDILQIHTKKVPFAQEKNRLEILMVVAQDLFSKSRIMYRVNNEHDFTLGDAVNGAMLQNIAESAKMIAMRRDIDQLRAGDKSSPAGVTLADFREATKLLYHQQRGLNHSYDLYDFAEKRGLQADKVQFERCFASA